MTIKHRLKKIQAELARQNVLSIHPPALADIASTRNQREGWKAIRSRLRSDFSGTVGADDGEGEDRLRVMVGSVAVIPILGVLQQRPNYVTRWGWGTSTEQVACEIKDCIKDDRVTKIVLYCDSPGGTALGNEELGRTIDAAKSKKTIDAFVRGMACSACYYVASAASKIVASPSSIIGSIGTIQVLAEYSKYFAEMGIKPTVLTYGKFKGAGNPYEPLTAEQKAALQETVTSFGEQFTNFVAEHRGTTPQAVLDKFGQGKIFLAAEAKQIGMVDAVADWDEFLAERMQTPGTMGRPTAPEDSKPNAAGKNAASLSISPASAASVLGGSNVNKKIKAALYARGIVEEGASDEACKAALSAWFSARGQSVPAEDQACIDSLLTGLGASTQTATIPAAAAGGAAPNVQAAHEAEMAQARQQSADNERQRIVDLQSRGRVLGISEEKITEAIASKKPTAEVLMAWTETRSDGEKPVHAGGGPRVLGEGITRFEQDALIGLSLKAGVKVDASKLNADNSRLGRMPMSEMALKFLNAAGVHVDDPYDREAVVEAALEADPRKALFRSEADGGFNRPSSFPNLLSALANKILDEGLDLSEPTYNQWAGRWTGDLPDFKPAPVVNKQQHDELDEVLDKEAFKEFKLAEEMLSYMQLARYGNKFEYSPVLIANDDLNAFREELLGLSTAHENTLNRLCIRQLTGNVTLLDTYSLFDNTNHGNDITSGAAPSATQWKAMLNKYYAQRGIGTKGYMRGRLNLVIVPPTLENEAKQTFAIGNPEDKVAATDATINTYRGSVQIVIEPELQGFTNGTLQWYGMVRPSGTMNATVVYSYFRGWGQGGRRERWYDPNTKAFNISLEGRFGAAAKQYRTAVRNAGQ